MKIFSSKLIFALILLFLSIDYTFQLQIPIKLVKSNFRKRITKKTQSNNDISPTSMISEKILDLDQYVFAIDITIGSDKQPFTFLIDTGSEIAWVPGVPSGGSDKFYKPESSTTSKRTSDSFNYEYSDGIVSGQYYYDQINFILTNSFYFTFGVATRINLKRLDFDGILGLARKYSSNTKKYSILQTLKTNGAISSTKFSFKYDYNTKDLTFYLGEIHSDFNSKSIASCSLIESDSYDSKLWTCEVYSFGVKKGNDIIKRVSIDCEGLFDTGTNNMMFPIDVLNDFKSTFEDFNCYIEEEGDRITGSMKAVYCRDANNLPKITFGLKNHILTLGRDNFYSKMFYKGEYIYRLRLLFVDDSDICVIGQNFFYEYHTLFDDDKDELKFYSGEEGAIIVHEEKTRIKLWVLLLIIFGSLIIAGSITVLLVYFFCCRKKEYAPLQKELLEMSSIQKVEENINNTETAESSFNHIMNITTTKKSIFNINRKKMKNKK